MHDGNISFEETVDGLITGKRFYCKNLVFFISQKFFFFLTLLACLPLLI